ncbi:hypothetical protein KSF_107760 [Reticulibacter mediterranei]|uniref:HEAT repeat domain-containing protein n=1 Tax=Reticulibacter mediterranei TaxID=2778369 RepID=A0A8J3IUA4_9CHLR|nr:HEAT repeat domain-containing protein [Reticulibacter mediterranei]GHP00729.1 hypothetical protein KSF_107760 [Reticulibacter mediterranei]
MRLLYTITAVDNPPRLLTRVSLRSHEIYSPHVEVTDPDDDAPDAGERVDLGIISYPWSEGGSVHLLPPILLIEAFDDQQTARQRYALYGGYRYIGQVILPDGKLGEAVEICLSREALEQWELLLPRSEQHLSAQKRREMDLADLFLIEEPEPSRGLNTLAPKERALIKKARASLEQGDASTRTVALSHLALIDPLALPLASIFPCLGDTSDEVRHLAVTLLGTASNRLPINALEAILDHADLPVRLAAITLLGKVGGDAVLPALQGACSRRHPLVRIAGLRALIEASETIAPDSVFRLDTLTYLRSALHSDDVEAVRRVAAELIEQMGGIAILEARIAEHDNQKKPRKK